MQVETINTMNFNRIDNGQSLLVKESNLTSLNDKSEKKYAGYDESNNKNNNNNNNRSSIASSVDDMNNMFTKFAFPFKLHSILENVEKSNRCDIISWLPNGKAFKIHKPKEFADVIMPQYFNQTKYRSFQRQLYIYGFDRVKDKTSDDYGAYFHDLFIKGLTDLCLDMTRQKIKGTGLSNEERRRQAALSNKTSNTKQKSAKSTSSSSSSSSSPYQQLQKLSEKKKLSSSSSSSSSPSSKKIYSASTSLPSSLHPSLDVKCSSFNSKPQKQTPRRVSKWNDKLELMFSSTRLFQQQQLQLNLQQQHQQQRIVPRRVSEWNSDVAADIFLHDHHHQRRQQHYQHQNGAHNNNKHNHNFECYLNGESNRNEKRRRCSLGFVRSFERRGSLLHDGDEVCFNDKKFFFTTEY